MKKFFSIFATLVVLLIFIPPCFSQSDTSPKIQISERQSFHNGKVEGIYTIRKKDDIPFRVKICAKYKHFDYVYTQLGKKLPNTIVNGCNRSGYAVHKIKKNESLCYDYPVTDEYRDIIVAFLGEDVLKHE